VLSFSIMRRKPEIVRTIADGVLDQGLLADCSSATA